MRSKNVKKRPLREECYLKSANNEQVMCKNNNETLTRTLNLDFLHLTDKLLPDRIKLLPSNYFSARINKLIDNHHN